MSYFFWKYPALFLALLCCACIQASEIVLVTGASRGIGRAIVELLVGEDYIVYAGVRSLPSNDSSLQPRLHWIELDITDQGSVDRAIETIVQTEGRIDVLVNNAGIFMVGTAENLTIEDAKSMFDVNFFGTMRVTQAVLPYMRAQNKGRIIQISSRAAFRPTPLTSFYAASKSALEGISETMAAVLKLWNIQVSLIEPGPVNTGMNFKKTPFGSRLSRDCDPYFPLFEKGKLFDPAPYRVQEPEEIALIVKEAIVAKEPLFRYQTTAAIKEQASKRMVDITGLSNLREWEGIVR